MELRWPGQLGQTQQNQTQAGRKKGPATEKEKARFRAYNRSERGKARYRKWVRSPQGRQSRRRSYLEKVEWLNQLKAARGCCVCSTRDPEVLRLEVQPGQEVEFSPESRNMCRSKEAWLEVVSSCHVVCLNCKAKAESSGSLRVPKIPERAIVNDGKNLKDGRLRVNVAPNTCKVCLTKFKPKPSLNKREFCSDRCRLLFWAMNQIVKASHDGRASGLQELIAGIQ
jgi:predicted RNA-binding protein YlxR (DUF448 family)